MFAFCDFGVPFGDNFGAMLAALWYLEGLQAGHQKKVPKTVIFVSLKVAQGCSGLLEVVGLGSLIFKV